LGSADAKAPQAAQRKIPAIYFSDGFTAAGGLISCGASLATVYRRLNQIFHADTN